MVEVINPKLESSRLFLQALTLEQLILYKDSQFSLELELGLIPEDRIIPEEYKAIMENCNIPFLKLYPAKAVYGTIWIIIGKNENKIIGDIGFKGSPTDKGLVEVGYETHEGHRNKGYMTEALATLMEWAFAQHQVEIILAETDKVNKASQKTLSKNGFTPFAETADQYWWRRDKNQLGPD